MLGLSSMLCVMNRRPVFARPLLRNRPSPDDVIHNEDQLVVVIAVEYLDVNPSLGHPPRDLAELPWFSLVQSLDEYVPLCQDLDTCRLQRVASGNPILEEEVCHALAANHPC